MKKRKIYIISILLGLTVLPYCLDDSLWNRLNSPDLYYLEVIKTSPADGESNVALNAPVSIELNDNAEPAPAIAPYFTP